MLMNIAAQRHILGNPMCDSFQKSPVWTQKNADFADSEEKNLRLSA
jgi:hypothetical protein